MTRKRFQIKQQEIEGFFSYFIIDEDGNELKTFATRRKCEEWIVKRQKSIKNEEERNQKQIKEVNNMDNQDIKIKDIQILENVRVEIKDRHLKELMESIKQHGLKQPIGVGRTKTNKFVLIYGHRRLTACNKLGWKTIPALVQEEPSMKELLILNMVENIQRQDVAPDELGRICCRLLDENMNEAEISARLSVPQSRVKDAVRVFKHVPEKFRKRVKFMAKGQKREGDIPASVMSRALDIRRQAQLSAKDFEALLNTARLEELNNEDLNIIGRLIQEGLTPNQALRKSKNFRCYRIDVVMEKKTIIALADKEEITPANYIKGIIYGIYPKIKKPDFLK